MIALSQAETDTLIRLGQGHRLEHVANDMCVHVNTVKYRRKIALQKLGRPSDETSGSTMLWAMAEGLIPGPGNAGAFARWAAGRIDRGDLITGAVAAALLDLAAEYERLAAEVEMAA